MRHIRQQFPEVYDSSQSAKETCSAAYIIRKLYPEYRVFTTRLTFLRLYNFAEARKFDEHSYSQC